MRMNYVNALKEDSVIKDWLNYLQIVSNSVEIKNNDDHERKSLLFNVYLRFFFQKNSVFT